MSSVQSQAISTPRLTINNTETAKPLDIKNKLQPANSTPNAAHEASELQTSISTRNTTGREPELAYSHALETNTIDRSSAYQSTAIGVSKQATSIRNTADRELALAYSHAPKISGSNQPSDYRLRIIDVAQQSTFGQWRHQLANALKNPDFEKWLGENGFTTNPKIITRTDGMTVIWQGGKSAFLNDCAYSLPILTALKTLQGVPAAISPYSFNPATATLGEIALFYGETISSNPELNKPRAEEIQKSKTFKVPGGIAATLYGTEHKAEEALQEQQAILGKMQNQHTLISELTAMITDKTLNLNKNMEIAPNSIFNLSSESIPGESTSVAQYITAHGWKLPTNQEELTNLVTVLKEPPLTSPQYGNFGGGLSWPVPLDAQQQSAVNMGAKNIIEQGMPGFYRELASPKVFDFVTEDEHWRQVDVSDPRKVIEQLIKTPEAQALGAALENRFKGAHSPTSVDDWFMTAMTLGLEDKANDSAPNRNKVAGYDLAQSSHWGKPLSDVKKGLTQHLIHNASVHFQNMAPIAAYLLLSQTAPEVLVKDIPDKVTYGSHTWVSLKTAVARIEAEAPGKSSTMSFAQVMFYASKDPITAEGDQVEIIAQEAAILDWAVCNGYIDKRSNDLYSPTEIDNVKQRYNHRLKTLEDAAHASNEALPNRKEIALERLRGIYGNAVDLEKKTISQWNILPSIASGPRVANAGPYSLLDLYISGQHLSSKGWDSNNRQISVEPLQKSGLPNNLEDYNKKHSEYTDKINKSIATQVKLLISTLPVEDQKIIKFGELNIFREDAHTARLHEKPQNDKSLLINLKYKGISTTYEVNPRQGTISKRPDRTNIQHERRSSGHIHSTTPLSDVYTVNGQEIKKVVPAGNRTPNLCIEKPEDRSPLQSFDSERTQYIADALVKNAEIKAASRDIAGGITTFDTENPITRKIESFFIDSIPFVGTVKNFLKGEVLEGTLSLGFDIFGFVIPGVRAVGAAGKAASLVRGASKVSQYLAIGSKLAKRGISLASPTAIVTDSAKLLISGGRALTNLGIKGINGIRGAVQSVDLLKLAKQNDIAQGSFKLKNSTETVVDTLAKFDEKAGAWYAYDGKTAHSYGPPLEEFTPNVVAHGGEIKNFDRLPSFFAPRPNPNVNQDFATARRNIKHKSATGFSRGYDNVNPSAIRGYSPGMDINAIKKLALQSGRTPEELGSLSRRVDYLENLPKRFYKKVDEVKLDAEFIEGYKTASPDLIHGYVPTMKTAELQELTLAPELTKQEIGCLYRHIEKKVIELNLGYARKFSDEITQAGGTVTLMPQGFYLSLVQPTSKGQCAALSNTMAYAIKEGKKDTLIENLFTTMAHPEHTGSKKFQTQLTNFHSILTSNFYGGQPTRNVTYAGIISELSEAPASKSLLIGNSIHATTAGVLVNGNNKQWFYFDPNLGLATFTTEAAMRNGMKRALHNGTTSSLFKPDGKNRTYEIADFSESAFMSTVRTNKQDIDSLLVSPIVIPKPTL